VTVGDACYFLIGQIVNRELAAVRYQPTGGIIVNSPVKRPALAARVRRDWVGLDSAGLRASLLDDLRAESELYDYGSALTRLRFYYPDAYAGLSGADLQKRRPSRRRRRRRWRRIGKGAARLVNGYPVSVFLASPFAHA